MTAGRWYSASTEGKRAIQTEQITEVFVMKPVLAVRHVAHEGLGTISDALWRNDVPVQIVDAFSDSLPNFDPRMWSGLVVMGGPMNVDEVEKYPFLAEEVEWLRSAVDAGLPVLGVCLGAQLLAKALGARVYPNRVKEIGWYDIETLPPAGDDRLFGGLSRPSDVEEGTVGRRGHDLSYGSSGVRIKVFHWHGDTFDLPEGAVQLARGGQCENQAFRYGRSAYGLQFHMEVTAEIIEDWLCEGGNCGELAGLTYIDPAAIRREIPWNLKETQAAGRIVFDRFCGICKKRQ